MSQLADEIFSNSDVLQVSDTCVVILSVYCTYVNIINFLPYISL